MYNTYMQQHLDNRIYTTTSIVTIYSTTHLQHHIYDNTDIQQHLYNNICTTTAYDNVYETT